MPENSDSSLCQARLTENDGGRWLCILVRDHDAFDHEWAADTTVETEAQRVNRLMQVVLTEHLAKLQREAAEWQRPSSMRGRSGLSVSRKVRP